MTTEIFRNMLYGEFDEFDDPLENLESVILDECHYMNDPPKRHSLGRNYNPLPY